MTVSAKVHGNISNIPEVYESLEYGIAQPSTQPKPLMLVFVMSVHLQILIPEYLSASTVLTFTCSSQWLVFPFVIKTTDQKRLSGLQGLLTRN